MSIQALTYVLEHCEAQYGARCMMFSIANHADEHGENCWASVATMAHEARLSRRGAQEALAELREAGEIEAMGVSRGQTTVYRIVGMATDLEQVPLLGSREGSADSALPQTGDADPAQGGAQNGASTSADSAPKPSGTVQRTDTPLTPRKRGGRQRDRDRLESEREAWATEYFPTYPLGAVAAAMYWAERRPGGAVSVESVRAELDRMPVEPVEAAA